jgi:hypothetical protein
MFRQPNSAILISSPDGITSDAHGFQEFLDSEAEYDVEMIFVEHGQILLRVSSTLRERLSSQLAVLSTFISSLRNLSLRQHR